MQKKNHLELIQGIFFSLWKVLSYSFLISLCQIGHKVSIFYENCSKQNLILMHLLVYRINFNEEKKNVVYTGILSIWLYMK